ncbi:unnamed protein product [Pedinophyceae sp. YPF-701]|nr:unnamed protein product [Pedinophyceae sp. YPF-701]
MAVELRGFKAGAKLPYTMASVYAAMQLPGGIVKVVQGDGGAPIAIPNVRTHPVVDVSRNTEASLPNGYAEVEFTARVDAVANALTEDPRLTVEVWHRERFRSDVLLGLSEVDLQPLMAAPWIYGWAPLYANLVEADGYTQERVQVGSLRVMVLLEDLGPADGSPPVARKGAARAPAGSAAPPPAVAAGETAAERQARLEYEAAWELEMWRRAEEAQFRAGLAEREAKRMAALEAEWRAREQGRAREAEDARRQYRTLESRAREVLAAAEERERRVVAAEEAAARRRQAMEREHTQRLQEAEAAVRRLQVEFQHQIEVERGRAAEEARLHAATRERLARAEARAADVEATFAEYRDQQRLTPEAEMRAALHRAELAARDAEARAERATRGKRHYKDQVVKLARQLGALQRVRQEELERYMRRERRQVDAVALAKAAGEQVQSSRAAAEELREIRERLSRLRAVGSEAEADGEVSESEDEAEVAPAVPERAEVAGDGGGGVAQAGGTTEVMGEVRRLLREKAELLGTGLYSAEDPVIRELDARVATLAG